MIEVIEFYELGPLTREKRPQAVLHVQSSFYWFEKFTGAMTEHVKNCFIHLFIRIDFACRWLPAGDFMTHLATDTAQPEGCIG